MWLLPLMFLDLLANVWVCTKAFFKTIFLHKMQHGQVNKPLMNEPQKEKREKNQNSKNLHAVSSNSVHKWDKTERSGNGLRFYTNLKKAENIAKNDDEG